MNPFTVKIEVEINLGAFDAACLVAIALNETSIFDGNLYEIEDENTIVKKSISDGSILGCYCIVGINGGVATLKEKRNNG